MSPSSHAANPVITVHHFYPAILGYELWVAVATLCKKGMNLQIAKIQPNFLRVIMDLIIVVGQSASFLIRLRGCTMRASRQEVVSHSEVIWGTKAATLQTRVDRFEPRQ